MKICATFMVVLLLTSSCTLSHRKKKVNGVTVNELSLTPLDKREAVKEAHRMSHGGL